MTEETKKERIPAVEAQILWQLQRNEASRVGLSISAWRRLIKEGKVNPEVSIPS